MLDMDGPGRITHMWVTVSSFRVHETFLRDLVIRMTWDHAPVPAVVGIRRDEFTGVSILAGVVIVVRLDQSIPGIVDEHERIAGVGGRRRSAHPQ